MERGRGIEEENEPSNTDVQHLVPVRLELLHQLSRLHGASGSLCRGEGVVETDCAVAGAGEDVCARRGGVGQCMDRVGGAGEGGERRGREGHGRVELLCWRREGRRQNATLRRKSELKA